jgi:zinc transporter 1/2/3
MGITLGIILSDFKSKVIEGIFLAMSSGTFIYVAASEIIVEEFAVTRYKYQKFFAFLMGGFLIAGLAIFETLHEHEH